jgi:dipeptidyl aminopeptidase/acylaminoacyl peptidase
MAGPRVASYGSWKSPITADRIVAESITLGRIVLDGPDTYWAELRPSEEGRNIIVKRTPDGATCDVTPELFSVGTRVHEYGARGYIVAGGVVYFSDFNDQRLHRHPPGEEPSPITPEGDLRYAGMIVDRVRKRIICVREDHTADEAEPINTLVSIDINGREEAQILVSGGDFYAYPRISHDGAALAWLTWNHPNMPWDGTELWMAYFNQDGSLAEPVFISGGVDESVAEPGWSPDGVLYFVSDRSGWSNLYRWHQGRVERVLEMKAEFTKPFSISGYAAYGFESESSLICSYCERGIWHLARLNVVAGSLEPLPVPYSEMGPADLKVAGGRVVFEAGSPLTPMSLLELDLATEKLTILQMETTPDIDTGYLSAPQPIEFPTEKEETAHAFWYPPKNQDFVAPEGEKPPLLVTCHGGPTGAASLTLDLWTQYWTSRGIGVLDVNYGGSTGYGRDYRERLIGEWGVVDVDDAINGALYLVNSGDVDESRLAITGGSAGGYTALAAMTFRDLFKAGASHFGVSDLEALLVDIHKFDTHSLDGLVGPYPLFRRRYMERSPINYAEQLTCPVIFFQGLEDTIVPANQSEMMFEVLKGHGVPTAYIAFEGEYHGLSQAENIKRSLEAELYFYSQVFGFELADPVEPVPIENREAIQPRHFDVSNNDVSNIIEQ